MMMGSGETFDEVIFACNADQTLEILDDPTSLERYILSSIRYDSEIHHLAVVHSDASVPSGQRSEASDNAQQPYRTIRRKTGQL